MKMDAQILINILGGIILAGVAWAARELWSVVKSLREDVKRIEVNLPTSYVQKNDFADGLKEIKEICGQISERMDHKQDKL
jgi:hypothetical protein